MNVLELRKLREFVKSLSSHLSDYMIFKYSHVAFLIDNKEEKK